MTDLATLQAGAPVPFDLAPQTALFRGARGGALGPRAVQKAMEGATTIEEVISVTSSPQRDSSQTSCCLA